ncbi:AraC family transcriptional regulator [Aestuariirhabdus sp. Z084]|uniref:AraC family transcriptional regulator n=1 Tax=Aestuariirhabdus haliotis TaxID=2918751 RepID=UPI00201B4001|nr:AraC family transcriptional regulator [Aestuariirhabdus haliotis]MCL6415529.1 AraC family transcriptional regulator [Aestuariirhabdus haliotis]MCL6419266.1 AraC family transcriptional regulator [Aestuariirhabdus haliotis]
MNSVTPSSSATPADISSRVDETLGASRAQRHQQMTLPGGISLGHWSNHQDRVSYENLNHHTLSLYLQGGGPSIRRRDLPQLKGQPDSLCLFPVGHDSQWEIDDYLEFIHLYFTDEALGQLALTALDLDPRRVALPDLTYFDDPELVSLMHREMMPLQWQGVEQTLALQQASEAVMLHLLKRYVRPGTDPGLFRGGLTLAVRKRVEEYMRDQLHRALSLEELAGIAQLSPFHFNRMFRISMACTPHQYLTRLRIEHARERLSGAESIAEIALDCGFSNQSHFGRVFRQLVGVTPARYRKAVS